MPGNKAVGRPLQRRQVEVPALILAADHPVHGAGARPKAAQPDSPRPLLALSDNLPGSRRRASCGDRGSGGLHDCKQLVQVGAFQPVRDPVMLNSFNVKRRALHSRCFISEYSTTTIA